MPTKTFSGRGDVDALAYADALAERDYGMSYGQFCGSVLLDYVRTQQALPRIGQTQDARQQRINALRRMREMSERLADSSLATMTDSELKDRIASRYD